MGERGEKVKTQFRSPNIIVSIGLDFLSCSRTAEQLRSLCSKTDSLLRFTRRTTAKCLIQSNKNSSSRHFRILLMPFNVLLLEAGGWCRRFKHWVRRERRAGREAMTQRSLWTKQAFGWLFSDIIKGFKSHTDSLTRLIAICVGAQTISWEHRASSCGGFCKLELGPLLWQQ